MKRRSSETGKRGKPSSKVGKVLKCFRSGEQLRTADEMVPPENESLATKDHKSSESSSRAGEATKKLNAGNIEEAESSLHESGCLNYEVCFLEPICSYVIFLTVTLEVVCLV